MQSRPIRFFHRGAVVEVADAAPTRSVLDWLREDARCTGTKEGCNEGDCGACTVVVADLAGGDAPAPDASAGLALRTVNACLRFLPTLDGKALFTVEDLQRLAIDAAPPPASPAAPLPLHPVQEAMVEAHASQCGFCTPGFVMSLWACYEHHAARGTRPDRQQLADEISGNLCRCTGYRPILDAGERMFDAPALRLDRGAIVEALRGLRSDATFRYATSRGRFEAPQTVEAFAAARLARPEARVVAGTTDVGLWITKQLRDLPDLLYVGEVEALKRIETFDDTLRIGAAVSLEDAYRALAARWPTLVEVWLRFASVPIRNAGTMGGNVANGSPIGDSAPVLMALGASVVLRRGDRVRRLPVDDLYTGYMRNRIEPGEFVLSIEVPLASRAAVRVYKLSKRYDSDISAVCAAFAIELDDAGVVVSARLAFGGMAAIVRRAAAAEAALVGRPWDETTLAAAQAALAVDFQPLSDLRASAAYRLRAAQNLLRRCWLETRRDAPLAAEAVSVWHAMARPSLATEASS